MASIVTIPLPAERFFRISLFFVVLISVATLSITGKLDPITTVLLPLWSCTKDSDGGADFLPN